MTECFPGVHMTMYTCTWLVRSRDPLLWPLPWQLLPPSHLKGSLAPTTAALTQALQSGTSEADRTSGVPWPPAWVLTALELDCALQRYGIQATLLSAEWHCHLDPKWFCLYPAFTSYIHSIAPSESQALFLSQTRDDQTATDLRELEALRWTP